MRKKGVVFCHLTQDGVVVMQITSVVMYMQSFYIGKAMIEYRQGQQRRQNAPLRWNGNNKTLPSMQHLQGEVREMFDFAFGHYSRRAFPLDDLRPMSCSGSNSQGGMAITLLDSMDSLYILGRKKELRKAVLFVSNSLSFDIDARVHVFEVTIRGLGGLLSAHTLLSDDKAQIVPWYRGQLLDKAVELANRLLPAFDTGTGIPLSWINLKKGQVRGDTRVTCTACAGTMLLEFGVLSRLTGDPIYETKARHAVRALYRNRSVRDMVGNTINVDTGHWVRRTSGIGAGIDSFYEYLFKAYLAFGDEEYLDMFSTMYSAIQAQSALSAEVNGVTWPVDVHMTSGRLIHAYVSSLSAFWPGLQALCGNTEEAQALFYQWSIVAQRFKWIPEMFPLTLNGFHPSMKGYPLRPEFIESGYILYSLTKDPAILATIVEFHDTLKNSTRVTCGFASVSDASTGRLEDSMESFFLSETLKYLYLMFSNTTWVLDQYVLSTEAHLLPTFAHTPSGKSLQSKNILNNTDTSCSLVCEESPFAESLDGIPKLLRKPGASERMRQRRCTACRTVKAAVQEAKRKADMRWRMTADRVSNAANMANMANTPPHWAYSRRHHRNGARNFLCLLEEVTPRKLHCSMLKKVSDESITSQAVQSLPPNSIFFQATDLMTRTIQEESNGMYEIVFHASNSSQIYHVPTLNGFLGASLLPNCNSSDPDSYKAAKAVWSEEMDALYLQDTEEETLYLHEKELTNEEVLQRIEYFSKISEEQEPCMGLDCTNSTKPSSGTLAHQRDGSKQETQCDSSTMPQIPSCDIWGHIVRAVPENGCVPLENTETSKGAIVLVRRGGCSFAEKAKHVSAAQAASMVVINHRDSVFVMENVPDGQKFPIPCTLVSKANGKILLEAAATMAYARMWIPPIEQRIQSAKSGLMNSIYLDLTCPNEPLFALKFQSQGQEDMKDSSLLQVDMVVPPNSQNYVINHLYQQQSDFSQVFSQVSGSWK